MNSKLETLHIIFDMVKNKRQPTSVVVPGNELILSQKGAWDEIVKNLNELHENGYVQLQQVSTMFVSITEKGFDYMSKYVSAYR